ncbi:hypothetical protein [Pyruvatibacter mobilis]|uniref:hypothetical protein n=1 Tax=Pyruvatibacter mobilis TaxID=1712261 RepID=UPI003BAFDD55
MEIEFVNCINMTVGIATLISIIAGGITALIRSIQVERGRWEEDFVDHFFNLTDSALKELRELSTLNPVLKNPQRGEIEANELLLRTWRILESYRSLRYRALAFGERPKFVEELSAAIDDMEAAYRLLENRDANGFNKMKYLIELTRIHFLDGLDRGNSKLVRMRNSFVRSDMQRIKNSFEEYI